MRLARILVTNDDGIDAPGLAVAEALAHALADEVWVVAPSVNQSGVGQGLSLHRRLTPVEHGARRFALDGTPADCVLFACARWLADGLPDLVLSGVNDGMNIADTVMYSGTVGAALCAQHSGLPAIALSQAFHPRGPQTFEAASALAEKTVRALLAIDQHRTAGLVPAWNVNFPSRAAPEVCGLRYTHIAAGTIQSVELVDTPSQPASDGCASAGTDAGAPARLALQLKPAGAGRARSDANSDIGALRASYISASPLQGSRCDTQRLAELSRPASIR